MPTPIAFAGLDWDSGAFLTALDRAILERGYGCVTTTTPGTTGTTGTLEQTVATGDVKVIAEEWAGRSPIWIAAQAHGQVITIGQTVSGGQEGIYVPYRTVSKIWPRWPTRSIHALVRSRCAPLGEDRPLGSEVSLLAEVIGGRAVPVA